ncbi:Hemin transport system permease protein HmuU [Paraglaciecola mesophila]|uniref:Hemin transport system permease protein HmuU n=1 Tax=Paraglaciecola mesophila TaxID=197222 RepID=A0A857JRL7_9ALTE|nr:iron ABC transporter permease [Paraglaciecola mesophila]QHJ13820.1 Hemin transport system permease protein HmuU [Paraglaciecola mesophila]
MQNKAAVVNLQLSLSARRQKHLRGFIFGSIVAGLLLLLGMQSGSFEQSTGILLDVISHKFQQQGLSQEQYLQWYVFSELRAPRMVMAMCVGALLAMSGCAMQGLVRNPLADPGLIGISGGAAAAAATALAVINHFPELEVSGQYLIALSAFMGALLAVWIVLIVARTPAGMAISSLILAGVAVNALAGTHIGAISYMANDDALRQITYWTMGSLGGVTWSKVLFVGALSVPIVGLYMHLRQPLNLFALGENEAQCMGLEVNKYKRLILWLVAFSVALATALCGIIGFVGLVVPHMARSIFSADHKYLMPACGLLGAILMLAADTASRALFPPLEIPIGIVTSAVGAPFFLYLLAKQKSAGVNG